MHNAMMNKNKVGCNDMSVCPLPKRTQSITN